MGERSKPGLTYQLEPAIGELQPQRRWIESVLLGERISRPLVQSERRHFPQLGIDDFRLNHQLRTCGPMPDVNDEGKQQEQESVEEKAQSPRGNGSKRPRLVFPPPEVRPAPLNLRIQAKTGRLQSIGGSSIAK